MDSVAILETAAVAYHLPIRLKGPLILQSARRPVGREKMLYSHRMKTTASLFYSFSLGLDRRFVYTPGMSISPSASA